MEGIRKDTRLVVERLEGQVARLRALVWLLVLAMIGAGGFMVWQHRHPGAAAQPTVLTVKGLVVEGPDGQARLTLTNEGIQVSDAQGQTRIELALQKDENGRLVLSGAPDAPALTAAPGTIALTDGKKASAALAAIPGPALQLRRDGKVVVKQPWDASDLK